MLATKLILIEGLPGAGKSTTTGYLETLLQQCGAACRGFKEDDDQNPITCLDYEIKGLTPKMVHLWGDFARQAALEPLVTIIDSRLWPNTAMFMYMSGNGLAELCDFNQQVGQALAPLSPALIYLDQPDTGAALRRLAAARGEMWMAWALAQTTPYPWFTSRGLKDFAGWVQFFAEWQQVADYLFRDWPYPKLRVLNLHEDWTRAYQQMAAFLLVERSIISLLRIWLANRFNKPIIKL